MKRIKNLSSIQSPFISVCIGNFDGIHQAHQQLLSLTSSIAHKHAGHSVVCTFQPHPSIFFKQKDFFLIDPPSWSLKEKVFPRYNIDFLIEYPFDESFSRLEANAFLDLIFASNKNIKQKYLCLGYNFSCGHQKSGSINHIKKYCTQKNIGLSILPPYQYNHQTVSSSLIRNEIKEGNVQTVQTLLNRPLTIRGVVLEGRKLGQKIGFPTANIIPEPFYPLPFGVYIVSLTTKNNEKSKAVANWGISPTLKNESPLFEIHCLDLNKHLYGENITVSLHHYLRKEKKFQSKEELKQQILKDIEQTKKYFKQYR